MSKSKTLFDFFSKSPRNNSPSSAVKTPSTKSPKDNATKKDRNKSECFTPKSNKENTKSKVKRRTIDSEDDSQKEEDDEINSTVKVKRRRIVVPSDDDDSADEYKPDKNASVTSDDDSEPSGVSEDESPVKKRKTSKATSSPSLASFRCPTASSSSKPSTPKMNGVKNNSFSKSPAVNSKSSTPVSKKKKQANGNSNESEENEQNGYLAKEWLHDNLDWLKDDKIKDKYGKRKSDPDYNPRSLYVPESFKKNLTPAMKQWWDMKVDHYDTVLFFKVGKFYELYHMDAVVGVKELGLSFMKGEFAHSGFPEIAYGRFSECLVQKGYKVARVEQTETPQMMEERCRNMNRPTKFDKVVNREICQVTTKGTRTLTYQEEPMGPENNFLLAICEKHFEDFENELEYGICFVDTTIGKFTLSQFKDDRHRSRLLTLVALYPPVEIIYEKSSVSKATLQLLVNNLSSVPKEALNSGSEFWDSTKVLKYLSEKKYFRDGDTEEIPDALKNMLDEDDRLQQTPLKQYELAFKSLGACIWYLKECFIDDSLVTMKLFEEYRPADGFTKEPTKARNFSNQHMVLDGTTLNNLEIVPNNASENDGSLYTTMDFCSTKFGKRLFRYWLCSPLCNPKSIADRLDAIEDLMKVPDVVDRVTTRLKKIPDLERMLSKIHSQGISRSKNHPESRAIFYEADIYNRRKLQDFLLTLDGFKESIDVIAEFEGHAENFKSCLLRKCVKTTDNDGSFPDLSDALDYFNHAFDHKEAKKEGNIIPCKGVDEDYDSACAELRRVEDDLEDYLNELKRKFNCKVSYVGSGRTRFQVEIPDNKKVPEDFEFQGARKGFRRFYTDEARGFLARYMAAEESRELALRDVSRRIYAHFDKDYELWKSAIHCLATIDVLISLHQYNRSSDVSMCRPEFVLPDDDTKPFLEIVEGKHPSFLKYFTDDSYIPNSVYIGSKMKERKESINSGGRVVLVTGPNMGGKSTLMRQAGALVIMAQVGSFIPAVSMKLTPVDRIFTRVGANDQISKGESTFFVEASETASIIHHATRDSFVLVDELGRGTSTHDGTAIAYSVLDNLANSICCRTLFSTHYHSLVEDFHSHPTVGLGHMACMVEKDNDCPALERITFLYKFIDGACPKSYGFNVALLAGVSNDIVQNGFTKAQEMECVPRISKLLKKFLSLKEASDITSEIQRRIAAV